MKLTAPLVAAIACLPLCLSGCSTSGSNSTTTTPVTPVTAVVVTSVAPAKLAAGAAATTITITGSGFTSASFVQVGGVLESTTFGSATQLTALVPASQLTSGGMLSVIASSGSASSASGAAVNLEVDNPAAVITQTVPATLLAGTVSTTVALLGTGFVPTTVVQVSGSARPTAYVSPTQLNVILTTADLASSGALSLTAVNPAPGGGASAASTVPVTTLAVTSIAPAKLTAGVGATTLTITGTGFSNTTSVQVAGLLVSTGYVSPTQLTALVPAAQLSNGAMLSVVATSGGVSSASATLEVDNPAPAITQFVPTTLTTGSPNTSISVLGTGFVSGTIGKINGSARGTAYVSPTQINVFATAADLAASGALSLTAVNATPGGGASAAASVPVNNPVPGTITAAPTTVPTGATAPTTITVTGSNFLPTSTVLVGTSPRATTYVSSTQLSFQLTVADQVAAARLSITVANPAPVGGTSTIAYVTVATPTPTPVITQVSPTQFLVGSPTSYLSVYGTGLTTLTTIQWNGTTLAGPYSYYNYSTGIGYTTYVYVAVPATLTATVGTATVTATTPTAVQPLSNALSVSITNPPVPTLTSISVTGGPINTAQAITLYGTGFTAASTVTVNGASVTTTYGSSTSLSVALPASTFTLPGNYNLAVTTPAPGGGTSTPLTFTAYVPIVNNSMIYNPVNGLFYLSIPSSVGAPYGNSIVSVDPATGNLGTPIYVGSEPNKLAITSDGKYLWVGLDGASAVRKVDLTANTAGLQFPLTVTTCGYCGTSVTALALAALPGATDSVVVSLSNIYSSASLAIYDSGVLRGSAVSLAGNYYYGAYALQVDGTRNEIYAGSSGAYYTLTYSATGLVNKASATGGSYASSSFDEMQIASGSLYTDFGKIYDPESGALLGTIYSSGTTVSGGTTTADLSLGKIFVLASNYSYTSQIQIFNTSNYNLTTASVIPVSFGTSYNNAATRLTRWGTNGLAFHTTNGFFSLRSNLVKDLSAVSADLGVSVTATGQNTTGSQSTYTATVSNAGPSAATNVTLSAFPPASGFLVSSSAAAGSCSSVTPITCDLGSLASGSSTTVTFVVTQTSPGASSFTVQVAGSENDPVSTNNQATQNSTISGNTFSLSPVLTSVSPATIVSGSSDTVVTLNGSGFSTGSSILLGGSALPTTYVSSTQLTATVTASNLTSLGWLALSVSTPAPGGGASATLPLSVYSVITLGVNHILYDPFSRKIMASVGSGSTSVTGNSIETITPETASVGTAVPIGSQPTNLALTSDGQILYTILSGSNGVARYNMLTAQPDFTVTIPPTASYYTTSLTSIAAQPGSDTTIALDNDGYYGIFDFNTTAKTATVRGTNQYGASGSGCFQFLNAANLLDYSSYYTLQDYAVSASGLTAPAFSATTPPLSYFSCFHLSGGLAFANSGGVANASVTPALQLGRFPPPTSYYYYNAQVAPDTSLQRAFFLTETTTSSYNVDGIVAYNQNTFLPTNILPLNIPATEGNTSYTAVDLIRWGQDGIAALTNGGHIYLLRGPAVVPQLLSSNTAATLSSSSSSTLTHGSGNTLLTLTGSNFVPGVAVTLGGVYRTTTIVDATHIAVAIPASDLASAGTLSLIAANPGAPASAALSITVN